MPDIKNFDTIRDKVKFNAPVPEDEKAMAKDLKDKFKTIKVKKKAIDENQQNIGPMIEEKRIELIRSLFSYMKDLGVDPNDPSAINEFLKTLEKSDPDLFNLFEFAFSGLTQGLPGAPGEAPELPGIPGGPEGAGIPGELPPVSAGAPGLPPMPGGAPGLPPMPGGAGSLPMPPSGATPPEGLMGKFKNLSNSTFRK